MSGLIDGIYGQIIKVRNRLYDTGRFRTYWLDAPVVSVGNITVGGTGKTPTVILLAEIARELGANPGIILRGYGKKADSDSDETMLFRKRVSFAKIVAHRDRVLAGHKAIEQGANILIADDAFQHRRLGRDFDICLIDATFPFGGERLLPFGRLREPIDSLKRADLIIVTRANQIGQEELRSLTNRLKNIVADISILYSSHKPKRLAMLDGRELAVDDIRNKRVFLFAALARPKGFYETIVKLGANVVGTKYFPDHYFFTPDDLQNINCSADRSDADFIVCTEKDIVKLNENLLVNAKINSKRLLSLEIEMEISGDGEDILRKKMEQLLNNFSRDILERICMNK